jgi:hypothetical protein
MLDNKSKEVQEDTYLISLSFQQNYAMSVCHAYMFVSLATMRGACLMAKVIVCKLSNHALFFGYEFHQINVLI